MPCGILGVDHPKPCVDALARLDNPHNCPPTAAAVTCCSSDMTGQVCTQDIWRFLADRCFQLCAATWHQHGSTGADSASTVHPTRLRAAVCGCVRRLQAALVTAAAGSMCMDAAAQACAHVKACGCSGPHASHKP